MTSALFHLAGNEDGDDSSLLYSFSVAPSQQVITAPGARLDAVDVDDWDYNTYCESLYTTEDESIYTSVTHHPYVLEGIPAIYNKYGDTPRTIENMQVVPEKDVLGAMSKEQLVNMVSALIACSSIDTLHVSQDGSTKEKEIQLDLSSRYQMHGYEEPKEVDGNGSSVTSKNDNGVLPPWHNDATSDPDCRRRSSKSSHATSFANMSTAELVREIKLTQERSKNASPGTTASSSSTRNSNPATAPPTQACKRHNSTRCLLLNAIPEDSTTGSLTQLSFSDCDESSSRDHSHIEARATGWKCLSWLWTRSRGNKTSRKTTRMS